MCISHTPEAGQGPLLTFQCWPLMWELCCSQWQSDWRPWLTLSLPPSLPAYSLLTPSSWPPCPLWLRHTTERVCVYQDLQAQCPQAEVGVGSVRRTQGSKHCVRSSGTPLRLCDPNTGEPLFLLKLSFHSPPAMGPLGRGAVAGHEGGQWVTFWF